ncbi:MAG: response regulator transcription factor [Spirochaetes bacterium]|nr:response regulator transcription factor [Spirochaetota bacterium]
MTSQLTILIIDDELEILQLISKYILKEGFDVLTATNGLQGVELFKKNDVSLLILDLMLPDLDGLEICRRVRENSHIPIIMLTAKDSNMDKIIGLGIGADDYLTKPFDIQELIARTKAQLRRYYTFGQHKDQSDKELIEFPGLMIDKERHQVIAHQQQVQLTALEFDLLFFLAENSGRVFTKQQIITNVWPEQTYLDDNTLSVHIRRLRKKIEKNPDKPEFIKTIRNIGYQFNDRWDA